MISNEKLCVLLVLISVTSVFSNGNDIKEDGDKEAHSDRGGLWFGPRLGKRSLKILDEDNRDLYYKLLEASDALKYYYDQLPVSYFERRNDPDSRVAAVTKKVIFTPKLGRRAEEDRPYLDFTPRLGRRLVEDLAATPADTQEIYRPEADRVGSRMRYYSPRLGRNMTPRLGREINDYAYPEKIRLARSTNNTKDKN